MRRLIRKIICIILSIPLAILVVCIVPIIFIFYLLRFNLNTDGDYLLWPILLIGKLFIK